MKKEDKKVSNFKTAFSEILEGNFKAKNEPEAEDIEIDQIEEEDTRAIEYAVRRDLDSSSDREATIITKGTVIEGTIRSSSSMLINGVVNGNIESEKNVTINGNVQGDIIGNDITLLECLIKGNITSQNLVHISNAAKIIGDIKAEALESDGNILGNVTIANSVKLRSNSVVKGNIVSRSISIQEGSQLSGNLEVISASKEKEE